MSDRRRPKNVCQLAKNRFTPICPQEPATMPAKWFHCMCRAARFVPDERDKPRSDEGARA